MQADFVVEDQEAQSALLADPTTYGLDESAEVARIDTHASAVFLAGERVYKLKRAVRFSFMDFSDAAKRRAAAEREVALNRRTAPDLYLGVAPIVTAPDGRLRLGGLGQTPDDALDWVVVMRRFDEATLFDRQASAGTLSDAKLIALAREIARFHGEAEPVEGLDWRAAAADIARGNIADMRGDAGVDQGGVDQGGVDQGGVDQAALDRLEAATEAALAAKAAALDARASVVRRCHGDLHLRNICEIDGRPTLFDGIEFNDAFAEIDPLYDLAFLLMDLDHRGLARQAALARDRYLEAVLGADDAPTGPRGGWGLLPFYLSMRAAVRAKVSAVGAVVQEDGEAAQTLRDEADAYLARAAAYLTPAPARLVALGGFSGSGKSTLARAVAHAIGPAPGAAILRSDQLRKARFGVAETERLPESAYASGVSEAVYATLEARAEALLRDGVSVIADATFTHPESRARIERVAARAGVAFDGLWLDAPPDALAARVTARRADASDADAAVVARQLDAGAGTIDWRRLAAGGDLPALAAAARARLGLGGESE
ncbi:MAG: AAA family ATPase [Alphaproteobacteria bacterium]|nr:AAA family ATPase [Alphaproteobacteria bacterium]